MGEALIKLRGIEANMTDHGMRWFVTCELMESNVEKFFGDDEGVSDFHPGDMLYTTNEELSNPPLMNIPTGVLMAEIQQRIDGRQGSLATI